MSTEFPTHKFEQYGDQGVLILVDHASNRVPSRFNSLGLPDDLLNTHIAWDIGARELGEKLANALQGQMFSCCFSRLVVDANRDLTATDLIPPVSDQIPVPGNQMLTEADIAYRVEHYHAPYHQHLGARIEALRCDHPKPFVVSVHSFTKRLMGSANDRPWEVGLLWNEDEASAKSAIRWLRQHSSWQVGDNQPYDAHAFNFSIDCHVGANDIDHLTFEVRQDMLSSTEEIAKVSELLVGSIKSAMAEREK